MCPAGATPRFSCSIFMVSKGLTPPIRAPNSEYIEHILFEAKPMKTLSKVAEDQLTKSFEGPVFCMDQASTAWTKRCVDQGGEGG